MTKRQASLVKELSEVISKYTDDDSYDPTVVLEVLGRSLQRKKRTNRHLKPVQTLLIPDAQPHEILREQRLRLKLTVQALAKKCAVAQPNLTAMEKGRRPIGRAVAKKLGQALGVNYRVFL